LPEIRNVEASTNFGDYGQALTLDSVAPGAGVLEVKLRTLSDSRPILAHRAPYLAKIRVPDCGHVLALSVCRAILQQFS